MRLADERGFTLIETLVSSVLLIVVLGATLSILDNLHENDRRVNERADAVGRARTQVDQLAREMRNLASPTYKSPNAIDRAQGNDVIFQAVDPSGPAAALNNSNVRRVRYCLDASKPNDGVLWFMSQKWDADPPPAPTTTSCGGGGAGWSDAQPVAGNIVNAARGVPVFRFDSTTLTAIHHVQATLWIDTDPNRGAAATSLSTGVFLRNQNGSPTAAFTVSRTGARRLLLNGTASSDPENEQLDYQWFDGTEKVGSGATYTYDVPGTGYSMRSISLKVYDPAQLVGVAPAQDVAVP
ncbi:MAG TPA: prepilin-type N-terminal cleavage/methylation domain-containing protein [Solirubrobacteraceae bacterium]|jgi:Tfp pilus assembly protein PilV|nr:prepilin-type N-terminal cleavage/methylation domain-containing protein [Solirubrobacteraceae bacterium]